ncbi:hypothetical protein C9374_011771 [Naegleria lovaniensis]|uniref:TRP C-terminal domain-containing protein n=1 Tax=Naegleria lovaniensis TaxID=51637 RepID=A0AA88GCD6_NAELO|nr:uncharacterized protein C9374_011771 [Naegleria lovaniensis]KAG2373886.1 hypothetical protein C9374_011771 [Naegleria lovaniensis]
MKKFMNNCIHSFITFLSLAYMYIIQTSVDIFLCKGQNDGTKNLEQAPHITCFEGSWWIMFPFSVIYFLLFGLGAAVFFIYSGIRYRAVKLSGDNDFIQRFKFLFTKFKPRYFYYESIITVRKLVFSVLYVFLAPLQVIALGFILIFISFVIHMQLVPYSKKMHNLIEYVTLVATLFTLFLGVVFFYDVSMLVLAVLWDIRTRKKKEEKKIKEKLEEIKNSIATNGGTDSKVSEQMMETVVFGLDVDELDDDQNTTDLTSSTTNKKETINDVFSNLFSLERRKKKAKKIKDTGTKFKNKLKTKTTSASNGGGEDFSSTNADLMIEMDVTSSSTMSVENNTKAEVTPNLFQ